MEKVDNIIQNRIIPKWVNDFLGKTFFEKCQNHDLQKNELNRYCISCEASICKYCIICGNHKNHKILTIYRHVYQNAVPLSEMENHIDCDTVQPYKCNKKWVVSLNPLPHSGSGSLIERDGACYVCKRKLTDPCRFRFCSITCKVQAILGAIAIQRPGQQDVGTSQSAEVVADKEPENPSKRQRSRKGVPHRAPSR